LALEALQEPLGFTGSREIDAKLREAITAIKQALAAPVQFSIEMVPDPVATVYPELYRANWDAMHGKNTAPPSAQPAPVPLTLWTEAQHERAYRNSRELHKDVKSLAAFKRVAKEVAAMYGITKGQP
jgi:hypothetical protein